MTDRAVRALLEPSSVAVVGATDEPRSFGANLVDELLRSPAQPRVHLVNPRRARVLGRPCVPTQADIGGPVDLVLLAVPDRSLAGELDRSAAQGSLSAVVFGAAAGAGPEGTTSLRDHIAGAARRAGMALCGGGCMGYANVTRGLRVIGYVEPDPLPAGPVALVTHSGSAFSALLRARRAFGWTLAVSSGQELVTTTAAYLDYALDLPETKVVALLLEAMRDGNAFRAALRRAADQDVAIVAMTVGSSTAGRRMVEAHSGALTGADGAWEALFDAYGVLRVRDLAELADTVELLAAGRRARRLPATPAARAGLAAVHDSGAERAHLVDLAAALEVPFADLAPATLRRLGRLLDPGLEPDNPLDVWGTGAGTQGLFTEALSAMADDPAASALALCVDLVPEMDGDESYPLAVLDVHARTEAPIAVLSNLPSAVDTAAATRLRAAGVPVLEGARSGLAALGHLLALRAGRDRVPPAPSPPDERRRALWAEKVSGDVGLDPVECFALLDAYGIASPAARIAATSGDAVEAAGTIGYPVVIKTAEPGTSHKTEVDGVVVDLRGPKEVAAAYEEMAARLGPSVLVAAMAPTHAVPLALGLVRDPQLGPLLVLGAGGVLVEQLSDRAVGLPPIDAAGALRLLERTAVRRLLDGVRGRPAADIDAVARAVAGLSQLALELGELLDALDVNPLACGAGGALALDVLVEPAATPGGRYGGSDPRLGID